MLANLNQRLKVQNPKALLKEQLSNDLNTNGGYVTHLLRLGHASKTPRELILMAPVGCGITAILTASPLAVGLVAAGFGYAVYSAIGETRKLIRLSHLDPAVLANDLSGEDCLNLRKFFSQQKPDAPCVIGGNPMPQHQAWSQPKQQPEQKPGNVVPFADPKGEGEIEQIPPHLMPKLLECLEIPFDRRNAIFPTSQRSGKSNTIRGVMQEQKQLYPDMRVHYVTTKIDDEVPDWWNGHLIDLSKSRAQQIEQFKDLIEDWHRLFGEHACKKETRLDWLIIDEAVYLYGLAKKDKELQGLYEHLLEATATQGSSIGMGSVIMGQSENAKAFGISEDLLRKNYLVFCPARHNHNESIRAVEKLVRGKEKYPEQLRAAAESLAKQQDYSVFAAYDFHELCVYFPPEYTGPLKKLEPVLVGGNELQRVVLSKIGHQPVTASDINRGIPSQNRPGSDAIQAILDKLVDDGEIETVQGPKTTKYRAKVLPPTAPPSQPVTVSKVVPMKQPSESEAVRYPALPVAESDRQRAEAIELRGRYSTEQLAPELAVELYQQTGNPRILLAFQHAYVGARYSTDAEYDSRVRALLQEAS
jgi:hypothetical protein